MNFLLQSYVCMYIFYNLFFLIQFNSMKDTFPLSKIKLYALDFVLIILLYNCDKKYNIWIITFALNNS